MKTPVECRCHKLSGTATVTMQGKRPEPTLTYELQGQFFIKQNKPHCLECKQQPCGSDWT